MGLALDAVTGAAERSLQAPRPVGTWLLVPMAPRTNTGCAMPLHGPCRRDGVRAVARPSPPCYSAVGVIVTGSCAFSLGSGIVTSSTPSWVLALIFFGSTPSGSAIVRAKAP